MKGDIDAFSEFIRLYLTRYERWSSPLFLFGESYGTTCAAGIAGNLVDQGISFNGITLLSTALELPDARRHQSNDQPYILLIPSFTMIAGYHKQLPPDLMQDMAKARQESEQWASTEYAAGAGQRRCDDSGRAAESHRSDGALHRLEKRFSTRPTCVSTCRSLRTICCSIRNCAWAA